MSSELYPLGQLCQIKQGKYLSPSEMSDVATQEKSIPVIGGNGILGYTDKASHTTDVALITCRGSKCGLIQWVEAPVWVSNNAMACDTGSLLGNKFLRYLLGSVVFDDVVTGSAQPQITIGHLSKKEFLVCKPEIWGGIVDILGALDDRITLLRESNKTLEAIAQAIFKSWFIDFDPVRAKMEGRAPAGMDEETAALFPDELVESELGLVPKGWRYSDLNEVARFQNGYAFKSKDWAESGFQVVKIGNVKPAFIDLSGCSYVAEATVTGLERYRLARGDLLVGMTGYVGEVGLVTSTKNASYLNQRVGRMAPKNGFKEAGYLYCVTRRPEFKTYAESQSHGSAQANVSGIDLMKYKCTIPNLEVLTLFNDLVLPVLEKMLLNQETIETLSELRDELLPRLISGKLRLADAVAQVD